MEVSVGSFSQEFKDQILKEVEEVKLQDSQPVEIKDTSVSVNPQPSQQ